MIVNSVTCDVWDFFFLGGMTMTASPPVVLRFSDGQNCTLFAHYVPFDLFAVSCDIQHRVYMKNRLDDFDIFIQVSVR